MEQNKEEVEFNLLVTKHAIICREGLINSTTLFLFEELGGYLQGTPSLILINFPNL